MSPFLAFLVSPSHAAVDYSDMATLTRRRLLAMLGAGGGLLGLGYALRSIVSEAWLNPMSSGIANAGPGFGGATDMDISMYMEMFMRHNEIRRSVEEIPAGVRTTTGSDSPDLADLLHQHVPSMYSHLDQGGEIMCMSQTANPVPARLRLPPPNHPHPHGRGRCRNRRRSQPHESHPRSRAGSHGVCHRRHARDDAGNDGRDDGTRDDGARHDGTSTPLTAHRPSRPGSPSSAVRAVSSLVCP